MTIGSYLDSDTKRLFSKSVRGDGVTEDVLDAIGRVSSSFFGKIPEELGKIALEIFSSEENRNDLVKYASSSSSDISLGSLITNFLVKSPVAIVKGVVSLGSTLASSIGKEIARSQLNDEERSKTIQREALEILKDKPPAKPPAKTPAKTPTKPPAKTPAKTPAKKTDVKKSVNGSGSNLRTRDILKDRLSQLAGQGVFEL